MTRRENAKVTREEVSALAEVARWCLSKSLDARVDAEKRAQLLAHGERLNERVERLAAKRFNEDSEGFARASVELKAAIAAAKTRADDLDALADTLSKIAAVVGATDKLLAFVRASV